VSKNKLESHIQKKKLTRKDDIKKQFFASTIGENYWAAKMITYLRDQTLWEVMENGSNPTHLSTTQL